MEVAQGEGSLMYLKANDYISKNMFSDWLGTDKFQVFRQLNLSVS